MFAFHPPSPPPPQYDVVRKSEARIFWQLIQVSIWILATEFVSLADQDENDKSSHEVINLFHNQQW